MKNLIALFFSITLVFLHPSDAAGQVKPKMEVAHAKQVADKVEFTVNSAKPFIFGSNRYILNIGDKAFFLNKQWKKQGRGVMTFFIPFTEFNSLKEGDGIYLTYGNIFRDEGEQDREALSKENGRCWSLGKFSRSLLSK